MRFDPRVGRGEMRIALGLAVACLAAASAQPAGPDEAAVLAAQKERLQAMVRSDLDALGRLLPDDLTYTHASGVADTKASLLASIAAGKLEYQAFDPGQPRGRIFRRTPVFNGTATVPARS